MRFTSRSVPRSMIWISVCLVLVLVPEEVKCTNNGCNKTMMYEGIIPPGYQKVEPPVSKDGQFNVFISIQLYDVYGLNEETMDFFLHLYIFHVWEDSRLMLDCLTLKRPVKLPDYLIDQIWKPDIYFENSKAGSLFTTTFPNTNLKILQDSSVFLTARYLQHVSCPMYLRYYPMDVQSCQLRTGLYSFPDDVVQLRWTGESRGRYDWIPGVKIVGDVELPEYRLVKLETTTEVTAWSTGNYSSLVVRFIFARHLTAYLVNTYIPSSLVVVMSWLTFWLDIHAVPARITLGVTSLLTLVTQVVQSRSTIPPVGYVNALDIWLFVCLNIVFATLIEYAIAYTIRLKTKPNKIGINPMAVKYFGNFDKQKNPGKNDQNIITNLTKTSPTQAWTNPKTGHANQITDKQSTRNVSKVDLFSRIIFPVCFASFMIVYWIYYMYDY